MLLWPPMVSVGLCQPCWITTAERTGAGLPYYSQAKAPPDSSPICTRTHNAGELNFNLLGVIFQGGSIATESFRLVLIQILLQQRGIKLNPITTLYYVAPACFVFLCVPFSVLEMPRMVHDENIAVSPWLLLASAAAAFGGSLEWDGRAWAVV